METPLSAKGMAFRHPGHNPFRLPDVAGTTDPTWQPEQGGSAARLPLQERIPGRLQDNPTIVAADKFPNLPVAQKTLPTETPSKIRAFTHF